MQILQMGIFYPAYLLTGEQGCMLVDTGPYSQRAYIEERLRGKQINGMVLTHGHWDHTGNAAYFREMFGAPIAMHEADIPFIEDGMEAQGRKMHAKPKSRLTVAAARLRLSFHPMEPFLPDITVREGDTLAAFGFPEAEILELPGHTMGSIGIKVGSRIFVGDAMMNLRDSPDLGLWEDREKMLASMARVMMLPDVRRIYVGHGPAIKKDV